MQSAIDNANFLSTEKGLDVDLDRADAVDPSEGLRCVAGAPVAVEIGYVERGGAARSRDLFFGAPLAHLQ